MNCQSFENIVGDLAQEHLIEASLGQSALHHTEQCAACARRLSEERSLSASLRALSLAMNAVAAPSHVEDHLMSAFTQQQFSQKVRRANHWSYWNVAAAAAVLVVLGIGIAAWNLRGSRPTELSQIPPQVLLPEPIAAVSLPEPKPSSRMSYVRPRTKPSRAAKPEPATTATSEISQTEVASDFMPIGYVNSASLQDGGSVVRVELPRSTIVSLGFAVNMNLYGERVKADVLLGADGLARAIRFVQ